MIEIQQGLALHVVVEIDEDDKIDNLMDDSNTEFSMEEEISEEKNKNGSNNRGDFFVSGAEVHIESAENGGQKLRKVKESKMKFHNLPGRKEQTHMKGKSARWKQK